MKSSKFYTLFTFFFCAALALSCNCLNETAPTDGSEPGGSTGEAAEVYKKIYGDIVPEELLKLLQETCDGVYLADRIDPPLELIGKTIRGRQFKRCTNITEDWEWENGARYADVEITITDYDPVSHTCLYTLREYFYDGNYKKLSNITESEKAYLLGGDGYFTLFASTVTERTEGEHAGAKGRFLSLLHGEYTPIGVKDFKWYLQAVDTKKEDGFIEIGKARGFEEQFGGSGVISAFKDVIEWSRSYGGSYYDTEPSLVATKDGGYIFAGRTISHDGDVSVVWGVSGGAEDNVWVAKLSPTGDIQWEKTYGGETNRFQSSIRETTDGGYILAGDTHSSKRELDIWIMKLSSSGTVEWEKLYRGSSHDKADDIYPTADGGYILVGNTESNDGDIGGDHHGREDIWAVKLSPSGDMEWSKVLGGSNDDRASAVRQTAEGGYILVGETSSTDGDVSGNHGSSDIWVVKLSPSGGMEWEKALGGSEHDGGTYYGGPDIELTKDGGYILTGSSQSKDGDISESHGEADLWVVKLASSGDIQWEKTLGGPGSDFGYAIELTKDSGYILAGMSNSYKGDVRDNRGHYDAWAVKLRKDGDLVWSKTFGGSEEDNAYSIVQAADGSYVLAGETKSNDGDVSGNHGEGDIWVVKLNSK